VSQLRLDTFFAPLVRMKNRLTQMVTSRKMGSVCAGKGKQRAWEGRRGDHGEVNVRLMCLDYAHPWQ
jgi:hypothetical protein